MPALLENYYWVARARRLPPLSRRSPQGRRFQERGDPRQPGVGSILWRLVDVRW
jgi:hypothetical protein